MLIIFLKPSKHLCLYILHAVKDITILRNSINYLSQWSNSNEMCFHLTLKVNAVSRYYIYTLGWQTVAIQGHGDT